MPHTTATRSDRWLRASVFGLALTALLSTSGCKSEPAQAEPAPKVTKNSPAATKAAKAKARNAKFTNPKLDADDWEKRFQSERREMAQKQEAILAAMAIKPGETLADIGAGTGLFVGAFADAVGPTGKVMAVDVAKPFIDKLNQRFGKRPEVTVVHGKFHTTTLADNSVDVAFCADTYHHFDDPKAMIADLARVIKPGGRLVLIDFEKVEGLVSEWQFGHVHDTRDEVIAVVRAGGFSKGRFLGEAQLSDNWAVEFIRDAK